MSMQHFGELLDALDRYIPEPKRAIDKPFLMPIEGVHTIEGRGTVATGKIEQGVIGVGQKVEIHPSPERASTAETNEVAVRPNPTSYEQLFSCLPSRALACASAACTLPHVRPHP